MLLTLDLATRTGWTIGAPEDRAFRSGSVLLPSTSDDVGAFILAYDDWIRSMLTAGVTYCAFEAPIMPRQTQIATLRKLYGLAAHTEFRCKQMKVRCREAPLSKVRAFILKGNMRKEDVLPTIERYGFRPKDDDEADAIAVRLYVIAREYPQASRAFSLDMGPLGAIKAQ